MSANTSPIFVLTPKNWFITSGTSANTAFDGTGTVATIVTGGAAGSRISKLRLTHMGTNIKTVVRLFINNGSTNATASNNALVYEYTMAANSADQDDASVLVEIPLDLVLAPTYKLNATIGTAIASGIMLAAEGGDY